MPYTTTRESFLRQLPKAFCSGIRWIVIPSSHGSSPRRIFGVVRITAHGAISYEVRRITGLSFTYSSGRTLTIGSTLDQLWEDTISLEASEEITGLGVLSRGYMYYGLSNIIVRID